MSKWNWDRIASAGGIVAVVLFIVSTFVTGAAPPKLTASPTKIANYFLDHHRSGLVGSILFGLGIIAMILFVGMLASAVRRSGEDRFAAVTLAGAIIAGGMAIASTVFTAGLYYGVALNDPTIVRPLYVTASMFTVLIGFPTAVWMGSVAIASARTQMFPQWYTAFTWVAALVSLAGGCALMHKGFYSPTGAFPLIAFLVFAAWTAITSGLLVAQHDTAPATALSPA